ncbi:MAG: hypothetical protein IPM98_11730 [Lewinellaceae bacterium]|nr:hypothetical protein [Lewinellaceae bacterium]
MSKPLSDEHRWIAEFWSDDVPGLTVSPMGRWISITTQAVAQSELPFPQVLELYLKTAIASSDVMVLCWKNKYQYNLERPESYIKRLINPVWTPLHDTPPFPSYPSGHAAMGATAAEVLRTFLGDTFPFTDRTHEGRTEFAGRPRSFRSFQEIAQENALYGPTRNPPTRHPPTRNPPTRNPPTNKPSYLSPLNGQHPNSYRRRRTHHRG